MRVQAYALLIGALASFAAVAAAMYITRNVDWYGSVPSLPGFAVTPPVDRPGGRDSWLE